MGGMTVVFDLDGTLVDSAPDLKTAVNAVLQAAGRRPITLDETRRFIGRGSRVLLQRAFEATAPGIAFDVEAAYRHYLDAYRACVADETQPFPGVLETLEASRAEGWTLALCTNKPEALALELLEALALAAPFGTAVVGGDTLPVHKPDPAPVHEAIWRAGGVLPAVLVGDSETDVAAARAAGIPVIAVPWGYREGSVDDLGADAVLPSFEQLGEVLHAVVNA
ncbi:MAG: phosphoglycolate phosphatase [Myxococcota bacterium]